MFTIGEFSRFAQVTTDLLRYYDKLDLFKPAHIDKFTGYRYYRVEQLTDLNRILALKDLGLSLEQIKQLLHDGINADEIRGMLTLQRLKVQETIHNEIERLQRIEARLKYLDHNGKMPVYDILVKSTEDVDWLYINRQSYPSISGPEFFYGIYQSFKKLLPAQSGRCVCVMHNLALESDNWSMGFVVNTTTCKQLTLGDDKCMFLERLPGFEQCATVLYNGPMQNLYLAYNALGQWIHTHNYQVTGETYEYFYRVDTESVTGDVTAEIQMPIMPKR